MKLFCAGYVDAIAAATTSSSSSSSVEHMQSSALSTSLHSYRKVFRASAFSAGLHSNQRTFLGSRPHSYPKSFCGFFIYRLFLPLLIVPKPPNSHARISTRVTGVPLGHFGAEVVTPSISDSAVNVKLSRNDEELLQKAIVYEAEHGFLNSAGKTKRFNEFLASRLSALSLENVSEAEKTLAALSNTAKNYDDLDVSARVSLLDKVCTVLGFNCIQDLLDQHTALLEASRELQTHSGHENSRNTDLIDILRRNSHPAIVFGCSDPVELYGCTNTGVDVTPCFPSNISDDRSNNDRGSMLQPCANQMQGVVESGSKVQKAEVGRRTITQVRKTRKTTKVVRPSQSYESWLLNKPICLVDSLTPYMSSRLEENGFYTMRKLLQHYPRTYLNFLQAGQIVEDGQYLTFFGKIMSSRIYSKSSLGIVEVLISSTPEQTPSPGSQSIVETRNIEGVKGALTLHIKKFFRGARYASKWFLTKVASKYPLGAYAAVSGKVKAMDQENHFEVKDYNLELVSSEDELEIGEQKEKIYPVYPSKGSLDAKLIESCIQKVLSDLPFDIDPLPDKYKTEYDLMELRQAYIAIHCPPTLATAEKGRQRFVFDEFFYLQLGLLLEKQILADTHLAAAGLDDPSTHSEVGTLPMEKWAPLTLKMLESLSYKLTDSQLKSVSEIMWDLQRPVPMRRLLQGDVGCGKTIVAFLALLEVIDAGFQGALMAPTEFLARQQYIRFSAFLEHLDEKSRPQVALLTSSVPAVKARLIRKGLLSGEIHLVVGTHSLIASSVKFASLRLAVIDEQHRFGVEQRMRLQNKGSLIFSQGTKTESISKEDNNGTLIQGRAPHFLAMTATPIPRTLAFALYGDMALSQINELPPGRIPVKTYAMLSNEEGLYTAFKMVRSELESGGRVFIVYPIIDESEDLPNIKAATTDFARIVEEFKGYNCGIVHGKLKPVEKEEAMEAFKSGRTQLLVATTVIEVGIDIVEASMMVVMHAERYGMAQLHQLRGRVGRGMRKSTCLLLTSSSMSLARVKVLEECNDGFHLAEVDLQLRGPGDLLGKQQSGHLAEFSLARFEEDGDLMMQARRAAEEILAEYRGLDGLPRLKQELGFRQGLDSLGV